MKNTKNTIKPENTLEITKDVFTADSTTDNHTASTIGDPPIGGPECDLFGNCPDELTSTADVDTIAA